MSLFKISDLIDSVNALGQPKAAAFATSPALSYAQGKSAKQLSETIGSLSPGNSKFFHTEGAWSNIELLHYILTSSGPANVYFCTWSISIEAIRKFVEWKNSGLILNLFVVLDRGVRNRKPEIYQQCVANFENVVFVKCHAKVTVVQNAKDNFCFLGSANYTENPRLEAGLIVNDKVTSDNYAAMILDKINGLNA